MTRCVYYRAYFHYARVFYSTCAFSRREIVCASGFQVESCFVQVVLQIWAGLGSGFSARLLGFFSGEFAPKALRAFGGIYEVDGLSFAEVGCQTY